MALSAPTLGTLVATKVNAALAAAYPPRVPDMLPPDARATADAANAAFWTSIGTAIAEAVVEHLTSAAEVLPSGTPPLEAGGDLVIGKGRLT